MLDAYLRIQRGLNVDSLEGVATAARAIAAEAAKLGDDGNAIAAPAGELETSDTLAAARAAFGRTGDAIVRYAKESGATFDADIKVAYCPMVNKRWLQRGDVLQNPFYGTSMSDCGRIEPAAATEQK
jgi:Cu(I)/Ag(I) efflux system membrane fusion protein